MSAANAAALAPAHATQLLAPGDVVDGRYRIVSFVAGGGMASVYRATHVVLEQVVAIKVISPLVHAIPGMAQRFLREAKAATRMKSEHVAHVHDVGTMPDGAPYIVMEYLDGSDLEAILEKGDEIPVEDAVDYALQACQALAEVHGLGIVHRDLKPANLVLTHGADGLPCIKLIDFGISHTDVPLAAKDLASLTEPQNVMGSPRYMSPEQMESMSKADRRSDIYGVGAVLYELLTRRVPFEGDTFTDIYMAATLATPEAPSTLRADVPRELDEVILRCLRSDPAERYVDAAELALALAPFGPAGSGLRAKLVARVLDATSARAHGSSAKSSRIAGADGSRMRRRVSSSAYSLHKRRIKRGALAFALLSLVGLAVGGNALRAEARMKGAALVESTPSAVLIVPSPPLLPAPASEPSPAPEPARAAPTPVRAVRTAVAPSAVQARAALAEGREDTTVLALVRPATAKDERSLFEDRK